MKVFDKIKDLFTDEVEVEEVKPVKKEVIQVEIPAPKAPQYDLEEEISLTKPEPIKKKTVSPFFDEKDFEDIKRSSSNTLDDIYREEERTSRVEKREAYAPKKEETKKRFEPTPIISPVYGVLDKNYKKDDIVDKSEATREYRDLTVDDVRNKAYGTLEDELESTLFGKTSIMFQKENVDEFDKKEEISNIEEELDKTAVAIDLLKNDSEEIVKPKHGKKETKEINIDKEELPLEDTMITDALNTDLVSDDKLSESDLFDLIDDMYGKGE